MPLMETNAFAIKMTKRHGPALDLISKTLKANPKKRVLLSLEASIIYNNTVMEEKHFPNPDLENDPYRNTALAFLSAINHLKNGHNLLLNASERSRYISVYELVDQFAKEKMPECEAHWTKSKAIQDTILGDRHDPWHFMRHNTWVLIGWFLREQAAPPNVYAKYTYTSKIRGWLSQGTVVFPAKRALSWLKKNPETRIMGLGLNKYPYWYFRYGRVFWRKNNHSFITDIQRKGRNFVLQRHSRTRLSRPNEIESASVSKVLLTTAKDPVVIND
jgi:hypothetical protein